MNCRFGTKREAPFEIAPGTTESVMCIVEPVAPGTFSAQLHVFMDTGQLQEIVLTVSGEAK